MRTPFVAGNWKMNLTREQAVQLAGDVATGLGNTHGVEVAVCPPSIYLDAVHHAVAESRVGVGAQNMYFEPPGAYTGELSGSMLVDVGCRYVIIGHSERRALLSETDAAVHKKLKAALACGLIPIVCVGETLEQREAGTTGDVIRQQFAGGIAGIPEDQIGRLVLAYEPVWAIGTGQVATPAQAEEVHADLRSLLEKEYNHQLAQAIRIQYGGSVKPSNAAELMAQPNIDGALVGGASLAADSFLEIIKAARSASL